MESFWNDLHYEEIHFRDDWQFEVQSDFACNVSQKRNISTQEFYIFIPNALQINKLTYSKDQFYKDRTNLIRFKTPEFSLKELITEENTQSPLMRVLSVKDKETTKETSTFIENELKLFGNIVRSAIRRNIRDFVDEIVIAPPSGLSPSIRKSITDFCHDLTLLRKKFFEIERQFFENCKEPVLLIHFVYVDEFISRSIDYYLTGFLQYLRRIAPEHTARLDKAICDIIIHEKKHREKEHEEPTLLAKEDVRTQEMLLYRKGLLNKFVLDALLLSLKQTIWTQKYGSLIGATAAGIAMLVYTIPLIINSSLFVINSLPFLILTIFIYIIKDRVKEGLKTLFHRKAFKWFSDYTTDIFNPFSASQIGQLKESFSFVAEEDLPQEIVEMRKQEYDSDLPLFLGHESIIYYKKELVLTQNPSLATARRRKLHNIFLFNIHELLEKASNAYETTLMLDSTSLKIVELELPKVYHINVILKNSLGSQDIAAKVEMRKFRIIIDKSGIKRIEQVREGIKV